MDTGLREAINRTKVYLFQDGSQAIKKPDKTGFFIDQQFYRSPMINDRGDNLRHVHGRALVHLLSLHVLQLLLH